MKDVIFLWTWVRVRGWLFGLTGFDMKCCCCAKRNCMSLKTSPIFGLYKVLLLLWKLKHQNTSSIVFWGLAHSQTPLSLRNFPLQVMHDCTVNPSEVLSPSRDNAVSTWLTCLIWLALASPLSHIPIHSCAHTCPHSALRELLTALLCGGNDRIRIRSLILTPDASESPGTWVFTHGLSV